MASISKQPKGRKLIQFVAPDGKRQSIRLGKVPQRTADTVKCRVESLLASKLASHAIEDETARWLKSLDSGLYDKLAGVGLVPKRADKETVQLGAFLKKYV